ATLAGNDPDLENLRRFRFAVVFAMPYTGAGAHHLNVARFGAPDIARAVLVRNRALTDIGDDFHVGMRMRIEARIRRDLVVVPDPDASPAHAAGIVVASEREVVPGP